MMIKYYDLKFVEEYMLIEEGWITRIKDDIAQGMDDVAKRNLKFEFYLSEEEATYFVGVF